MRALYTHNLNEIRIYYIYARYDTCTQKILLTMKFHAQKG